MSKDDITAKELMDRLNTDPAYTAARATKRAEQEAYAADLALAGEPLVRALEVAGWPVTSVWDLVNTGVSYASAIPVLLEHLRRSYPVAIREGIARALAVVDAEPVFEQLVTLFRTEESPRVKDGLAVAVSVAGRAKHLRVIEELLVDRAIGPSRILLLPAVARQNNASARSLLERLAADPDLGKEIAVLLKRERLSRAR